MMSAFGSVFLVVYVCTIIGICLYVLVLLTRFVQSHDRIATALERLAQNPPRSNP